ncbi:hypothetical protein, partial [Escherichia phage AV127]
AQSKVYNFGSIIVYNYANVNDVAGTEGNKVLFNYLFVGIRADALKGLECVKHWLYLLSRIYVYYVYKGGESK